jgi:predicted PurR-regulated permease PerM
MKTDSAPLLPISRRTDPAAPGPPATTEGRSGESERSQLAGGPAGSAAASPLAPTCSRPAPFSPRTRLIVLGVGAILICFFLLRISAILPPFLWAVVVAYVLNPVVRSLSGRTGMPRTLAVVLVYLVGLGAIIGFLALAIPRLNAQVSQLVNELPTITADLQARYFGSTGKPLNLAGFAVDVPQVTRQVASSLNSFLNNFFGGAFSAVVTTVKIVTELFLFMIVTFYLLLDAPNIGTYLARGIPGPKRDEGLAVARDMNAILSQYLRAQLVLITIMGTASFIVLTIMDVRFAVVLAPIVGLLEIFPIIGPFAAITLVTIMTLFSPAPFGLSTTASAVIVAIVFFTLRQIEDYAVVPNIVGHAVRLHPALILFAVAAGTTFGGALGLFLAVPVTGALKVLGAYLYQKLVPA